MNNAIEMTRDLKSSQINYIYKHLEKNAKPLKEIIIYISAHPIRVGAAQDLLKFDATMPVIMSRELEERLMRKCSA